MRVRAFMVFVTAIGVTVPGGAAPGQGNSCAAPLEGWTTSRPDKAQVVNTIVIHDKEPGPLTRSSLPTWNGSAVNGGQIREYVGITKQMTPTPTLLLIVSPRADCAEVQMVRQIVDRVLDCGTDKCVEVAP